MPSAGVLLLRFQAVNVTGGTLSMQAAMNPMGVLVEFWSFGCWLRTVQEPAELQLEA